MITYYFTIRNLIGINYKCSNNTQLSSHVSRVDRTIALFCVWRCLSTFGLGKLFFSFVNRCLFRQHRHTQTNTRHLLTLTECIYIHVLYAACYTMYISSVYAHIHQYNGRFGRYLAAHMNMQHVLRVHVCRKVYKISRSRYTAHRSYKNHVICGRIYKLSPSNCDKYSVGFCAHNCVHIN